MFAGTVARNFRRARANVTRLKRVEKITFCELNATGYREKRKKNKKNIINNKNLKRACLYKVFFIYVFFFFTPVSTRTLNTRILLRHVEFA